VHICLHLLLLLLELTPELGELLGGDGTLRGRG